MCIWVTICALGVVAATLSVSGLRQERFRTAILGLLSPHSGQITPTTFRLLSQSQRELVSLIQLRLQEPPSASAQRVTPLDDDISRKLKMAESAEERLEAVIQEGLKQSQCRSWLCTTVLNEEASPPILLTRNLPYNDLVPTISTFLAHTPSQQAATPEVEIITDQILRWSGFETQVVLRVRDNTSAISINLWIGYQRGQSPSEIERNLLIELQRTLAREIPTCQQLKSLQDKIAQSAAEFVRKEQFFSHVAHDLKTPVATIRACTRVFSGSADQSGSFATEAIDIVRQNCDRLEELLSNILTFSQYQAGALRASPMLFNVSDVVAATVRRITPLAQEKGIELSLTAPEDLPFINTTHHHFVRIVENVLGNALRYTERGSITISITMEPSDTMVLAIRDTGPGIPEGLLQTIQQEYGQAPSSLGKGVGLGLHIVTALLAVNNGTLRIASTVGEGSTFSLVFLGQKGLAPDP